MQAKLSVGHHNITKLLHACNHFGGEKKELHKYQWSKRWQKMAVHSTLFAWLISHQPAVLFSHSESATSNQPAVLFSQNEPAPAISHQPTVGSQSAPWLKK
jgi:hypothetical protein